jgi:pSer/pThr/pTyr-binding forkhead associated (FHA) protein
MIAIPTGPPARSQGAAELFPAAPFRRTNRVGGEDSLQVELVSEGPRAASYLFRVGDAAVIVGRCTDAAVRIADSRVSRRHCLISRLGRVLVVRDLGSTNGTFVNGFEIDETNLMPGDELKIGYCRFVVRYELPTDERIHAGELQNESHERN